MHSWALCALFLSSFFFFFFFSLLRNQLIEVFATVIMHGFIESDISNILKIEKFLNELPRSITNPLRSRLLLHLSSIVHWLAYKWKWKSATTSTIPLLFHISFSVGLLFSLFLSFFGTFFLFFVYSCLFIGVAFAFLIHLNMAPAPPTRNLFYVWMLNYSLLFVFLFILRFFFSLPPLRFKYRSTTYINTYKSKKKLWKNNASNAGKEKQKQKQYVKNENANIISTQAGVRCCYRSGKFGWWFLCAVSMILCVYFSAIFCFVIIII